VAYYLVQLRDVAPGLSDGIDHVPFIDDLVARNRILLGGTFTQEPSPGVGAAYVLRCDNGAEAAAVAAGDPLVVAGACEAVISLWDLVGINLSAVDPPLAEGSVPPH